MDRAKGVKVLEESIDSDYAILQLDTPVGKRLGHVPLSLAPDTYTESALLHYPLQQPLKVSVHTCDHMSGRIGLLRTYHDTDYFSSGGAYFNPQGQMIAMHLGCEFDRRGMNLRRQAVPIADLVENNPHSILARLARGTLSQDGSYDVEGAPVYLTAAPNNYLVDEEGYESEKVLRRLLGQRFNTDRRIKRTKAGKVSFSRDNLQYIKDNYPTIYDNFVTECTGVVGVHAATKQFSAKGAIESDHTIPHDVWKRATQNPAMRAVVTGGGQRPGENNMPAITIAYDVHRPLLTTGSSRAAKAFRSNLVDLCNQGKVDEALVRCFEEYARHGIDLHVYRSQIVASLDEHRALGVIDMNQQQGIIRQLF